jgi:hypothetical protein
MLTMRSLGLGVTLLLAGFAGTACGNGGGSSTSSESGGKFTGDGTQTPESVCPVFLPSSPWNTDISGVTVDPTGSNGYMANMNPSENLHPDFGSIYGIPYQYVDNSVTKSKVSFQYADESDKGPYPIPSNVVIEGGGDAHVLMVQTDECVLYELYDASQSGGSWSAGSGAIWDLKTNATRTACWTSADAAGLPIYPGLARYEEAKTGEITHALRFTMNNVQAAYTAPASHYAGDDSSKSDPPFGLHLRLKASTDLSKATPQAKIVLTALQKYGMFLADIGSDWYIGGAPDMGWDDDDLGFIKTLTGSDFEVLPPGPLVSNCD